HRCQETHPYSYYTGFAHHETVAARDAHPCLLREATAYTRRCCGSSSLRVARSEYRRFCHRPWSPSNIRVQRGTDVELSQSAEKGWATRRRREHRAGGIRHGRTDAHTSDDPEPSGQWTMVSVFCDRSVTAAGVGRGPGVAGYPVRASSVAPIRTSSSVGSLASPIRAASAIVRRSRSCRAR